MHNMTVTRPGVCRASIVSVMATALLTFAPAPVARADGDPASDYLVTNQVFLTSESAAISPAEQRLLAAVRSANRAGFAIRVAVISNEYDLGSITALWRRPSIYARFLGIELSEVYGQRLLVVMPNGFGFNWRGHSTASAYRLLAAVPPGTHGNGLALAAQRAVRRLAAAAGVPLAPTARDSGRSARGGGADVPAIIGAAGGALVVLAAIAFVIGRARRRLVVQRRPRRWGIGRAVPRNLRWVIPSFALCGVAFAAPILLLRRGGVSNASSASVVTPPPFSWPGGRRPAPNFELRDQDGRPVSLAAYRGRPVIVTFIDPLCRNLCPLEAQVLNEAEREMPASERPAILAVSVDVYADARADMLQDVREWHLVPQWRWAVGRPSQLAAVWRRYGVGVRVVTEHVAGTTINYITHTEAAYVIDSTGHERALFFWPFYPQDVKHALRQIA